MQLRRFTAESTPAALNAVRQALGDDAIILANRKIGDQVEIIATGQMDDAQSLAEISLDSVDSRPAKADGNPQPQPQPQPQPLSIQEAKGTPVAAASVRDAVKTTTTIKQLTAAIDEVEQKVEPLHLGSDVPQKPDVMPASQKPAKQSAPLERAANASLATELQGSSSSVDSQTLPEAMPPLSSEVDVSVTRHFDQLTKIIEAQSSMIDQYFKGMEVNLWGNSSPNRRLHLQKLFALGIGAEMAVQLVERSNPEHSIDEALRHSFALLKSTLPIGKDKTFNEPGVTILSGPPGAGKTTVLMKIATQHVREHGNDSIVIICADTRRIGAYEELQAYGRLLSVPAVQAHDSSELDSLLSAFTHKQLVLIDYTMSMDENSIDISRILSDPATKNSVRQLMVLSATAQSSTIDALIREQRADKSMQCVLTHLDANARLGEMFNALIRHHLPIAYWSDTASVQTPLEKADASVLVATAVAMSRRLVPTPDDEWLLRLIQPSDKLTSQSLYTKKTEEVSLL